MSLFSFILLNTCLLAAPLILVLDTRSLAGDKMSITIHLYVLFAAKLAMHFSVFSVFVTFLIDRCSCRPANGSDLSSTPRSTQQVALTVPIGNLSAALNARNLLLAPSGLAIPNPLRRQAAECINLRTFLLLASSDDKVAFTVAIQPSKRYFYQPLVWNPYYHDPRTFYL